VSRREERVNITLDCNPLSLLAGKAFFLIQNCENTGVIHRDNIIHTFIERGVAWSRSFDLGLSSAEGQNVDQFI